MTDKVYPSSKPNGTTTAAAATTGSNGGATTKPRAFPPTKSQLYNPNRHPYRPNPNTTRRRSFLCQCCFWSFLAIILLLLLASIAAAIGYLLYRPHRPTFSISSLKITQFNLTTAADDDSTHLSAKLNLTLSSKNPNRKLIFFYDPISITTEASSNQIQIANGSFQSFVSNPNNITIIHSTLYSSSQVLDADSASALRSDLRKKTKLPLRVLLDTQVTVKMDSLKSRKVGIRITCGGIKGGIPKGQYSPAVASISETKSKCKVDLRIKIWRWTF